MDTLNIAAGQSQQVVLRADAPEHIDITLENSATLRLIFIAEANHRTALRIVQRENSTLNFCWLALGGNDVHIDASIALTGLGATCRVHGLSLAAGSERRTANVLVEHAVGNCTSRQVVRQIAAGSAAVDFGGRVVVAKNAQHTDAQQTCRTLLLSRTAKVNAKPQLEIYADDVKCSHGATVGQLDAEALFYLRSRGIGLAEAQELLLLAFADEVLQALPDEALRSEIAAKVKRRMEREK